jgi:hypothetical protein
VSDKVHVINASYASKQEGTVATYSSVPLSENRGILRNALVYFTLCLPVKDTSRDYFISLTPDILNRKHSFLCVMDVPMLSLGHWIILT